MRDKAALDRGVKHAHALPAQRAPARAHARVRRRGRPPHGAEVRTLDEFFNRMIVVDRRLAIIPGAAGPHRRDGDPGAGPGRLPRRRLRARLGARPAVHQHRAVDDARHRPRAAGDDDPDADRGSLRPGQRQAARASARAPSPATSPTSRRSTTRRPASSSATRWARRASRAARTSDLRAAHPTRRDGPGSRRSRAVVGTVRVASRRLRHGGRAPVLPSRWWTVYWCPALAAGSGRATWCHGVRRCRDADRADAEHRRGELRPTLRIMFMSSHPPGVGLVVTRYPFSGCGSRQDTAAVAQILAMHLLAMHRAGPRHRLHRHTIRHRPRRPTRLVGAGPVQSRQATGRHRPRRRVRRGL